MKLHAKFFLPICLTLAILLAACSGLATPATGGTPAPTSSGAGSVPLAGGTPTLIGGAGSPTTMPATAAATSSSGQSTSAPTAASSSPQATSASTSAATAAATSAATTASTGAATSAVTSVPTTASTPAASASATAPASAGTNLTPTAVIPVTGATTSPSGADCGNAYFPLSTTASWTYASSGSVLGNFSDERTLSNLSANTFTTQDKITPGDLTIPVQWNCKAGNLTPLSAGLGNNTITVAGLTLQVSSANASGFAIPAAFTSGSQWSENLNLNGSMMLNGANQGSAQAQAAINCSAGNSENVTVPAGSFDAVKVTCHTDITLTSGATGLSNSPVTISSDETDWYARGVGLVKSIKTGLSGTETITLTKYTLP